MGYNQLSNDSGGDADSRNHEASRLMEMLEGYEDKLSEKEQSFIADLRERFEQYGGKTIVSVKQLFWLRDLKDKVL